MLHSQRGFFMDFQSDISFWWAVLAFVIGAGISIWYYSKQSKKRNVLLVLRLVSILILSILIVNPFSYLQIEQEIRPKVVVLNDNSLSIDSSEYSSISAQVRALLTKENEKELVYYSFSDGLNSNNQKVTDIASALENVFQSEKQNLSDVVLITDGISNKGTNPAYNLEAYTVPIHTVAMGDSTQKADVRIEIFNHPTDADEGASLPFDAIVKAPKSLKSVDLEFEFDGKKQTNTVAMNNGVGRWTYTAVFQPKKREFIKGTVRVSGIAGEINTKNNSRTFYVKQKKATYEVALVFDAPHPDIGIWQRALSRLKSSKVTLVPLKEYVPNPKDNSISILFAYNRNTKLTNEHTAYVIGNEKLKSGAFDGLPIAFKGSGDYSNVTPRIENFENIFSFGSASDLNSIAYKSVELPFGTLSITGNNQPLISQNTDGLKSNYPLLATLQIGVKKKAVYFGEGLWQYSTAFNMLNENPSALGFEALLADLTTYLLKSGGAERLEIFEPSKLLSNEAQNWSVNYINQNNEKIKGAEIKVSIANESGSEVAAYDLIENQNFYQSQIAGLQEGIYTYTFAAKFNNKSLVKVEKVLVKSEGVEQQNKQANTALLRNISGATNGNYISYSDFNADWLTAILNKKNQTTVVYKNEKRYWSESWGIWVVLLALLSTEWLLRRQNGLI